MDDEWSELRNSGPSAERRLRRVAASDTFVLDGSPIKVFRSVEGQ